MSLFLNKTHLSLPHHPPLTKGGQKKFERAEMEAKGGERPRGSQKVNADAHMRFKSNSDRGFTLLEVLIAVAIVSVVLISIYSTFLLSHRAIEGMDESLLKNLETRKAIDILKRELDATEYRENNKLTFLKIQDRDIYGKQAAQLAFTTFSPLRPGLSKISYYVEEKDGKLSLFKKVVSPYSAEQAEGVDIIEGLESFTVEALYNNTWVKTWDTDINMGVPDEIRISISVMMKGREVRFFDISQPRIGKPLVT